jgi:hypothetical protein
VVPANRGKETLVWICHAKELVFVLAEALDGLIVANCEDAAFFLHYIKDLQDPKFVQAALLISCKLELALLAPVIGGFEVEERTF